MKKEKSKIINEFEGLSEKEKELILKSRAGAKIIISPEKKASYNQLALELFKDIALKIDRGALENLKAFIENLNENSRGDKWNYIAYSWLLFKGLSEKEFSILKAISSAPNIDSALKAFPLIGAIWGKKLKNAISAESR